MNVSFTVTGRTAAEIEDKAIKIAEGFFNGSGLVYTISASPLAIPEQSEEPALYEADVEVRGGR